MPPLLIDVRGAEDLRDVVHRAVQALVEGKVVAFPTETVYGLAASVLNTAAVTKLLDVKGRASGHPMALAVKSADEALDFVPHMSPLASRLARRCWPGPVTLVFDSQHPDSLIHQLPAVTRQAVAPNGTVGLRVPAHPLLIDTLRMLAGPVVLSSANRTGNPDAVTAEEVIKNLGDDVQLVLDDGRCRFAQPSTVVRIRDQEMEILREGVVSRQTLKRLSSFTIAFVCTGNTCRSPMAEAICRKLVSEKLGVDSGDLAEHGVLIESAGVAAMPGGRLSGEAVRVLGEMGIEHSSHQSQPVTPNFLRGADVIFAMTRGHRDAVLANWPEAASRIKLMRHDGGDISDPIGGATADYRDCALQLQAEIEKWLPLLPIFGPSQAEA